MSLTLFSIIDFEPKLSDEALLIEEFKILHSLDYNKQSGDSQGRERKRAISECKYLYHFADFRSEFSEDNEADRHEASVRAAGLDAETFKTSPELDACIKLYTKLQKTRMLKTLDVAEETLDKLRDYYSTIDFSEKDPKSGLILHNPKNIMASIADLGNINKKLGELRKLVKAEMKETASLRGDKESGHDGAV